MKKYFQGLHLSQSVTTGGGCTFDLADLYTFALPERNCKGFVSVVMLVFMLCHI